MSDFKCLASLTNLLEVVDVECNCLPVLLTVTTVNYYILYLYTINLPDAITLDVAHNRGKASSVGLQGHISCCSR